MPFLLPLPYTVHFSSHFLSQYDFFLVSYKSFNLAIIRVQDTIYVAKVFNLDEEGQDIHPEDIAQA